MPAWSIARAVGIIVGGQHVITSPRCFLLAQGVGGDFFALDGDSR